MIGWWIVIDPRTPGERDAADDKMSPLLASWEASAGGIRWLEQLVREGKAQRLKSNGYPTRYTAKAGDVLPLIAGGPPKPPGPLIVGDDYVMPGDYIGKLTLHQDRIATCPPDQVLTVDAWDQS
jgi:hypothetical protein